MNPMADTSVFYDGLTSTRHLVRVTLSGDALRIAADGKVLAQWRLSDVFAQETPEGTVRVGLNGSKVAARLELHDPALKETLLARATPEQRAGFTSRRTRLKVVGYSVVAIVTLVSGAIWGVPLAADRIAPHLPDAFETRLGAVVDSQVRQLLSDQTGGKPFECGSDDKSGTGQAAFDKLIGALEHNAGLRVPVRAAIVRRSDVNAITLPGGRIYVFEGLLAKSDTPDELAGVIGHEMGHVAHRDGTKAVLQTAGLSVMFGMLLGDFTGGGAIVIGAKALLKTSYSRAAETSADVFGAQLMQDTGGDPHALGAFLVRNAAASESSQPHFLLDHPEAAQRAATIDRIPPPPVMQPLLSGPEWEALKKICTDG